VRSRIAPLGIGEKHVAERFYTFGFIASSSATHAHPYLESRDSFPAGEPMASLSPEIQRRIGIELRALYATSSDQVPDRLAGLLRQLEDKLEPRTKDEETGRAEVDHASE
jgi:hypothetical protein